MRGDGEHVPDAARILRAVAFSAEKHRGQRRKGSDAAPYINHPVEVANLLADVAGVTDVDTLVAALLHDTIEDTDAEAEEIEALFGPAVRALVEEVTDDRCLPREERKRLQVEHARHLSEAARRIKIADKIANVRDVAEHPPETWSRERRLEYVDWAERVVEACRGASPALEGCFAQTARRARERLSSPRG